MVTTSSATPLTSLTVGSGLLKALFIDLSVTGSRKLPDGPVVVAHNHISPIDQLVVATGLVQSGRVDPTTVMRNPVGRLPMVGKLLAASPLVTSLDSGAGDPFTISATHLAAGRDVVIAPEHAVSASLEVLPIRPSANRLAEKAQVPLVPVGIFGTHRLFTGSKFRPRLRVSVTMVIGNPLRPSGDVTADTRALQLDLEALAQQAMDAYPDRRAGADGADWWPASRGGTAPLLSETMNVRDQAMADQQSQQAPMWEPVPAPPTTPRPKPAPPPPPVPATASTPKPAQRFPEGALDEDTVNELLAALEDEAIQSSPLRPWQPNAEGFASDRRRYPVIGLPPHDVKRLHPRVWARMTRTKRNERGLTALVMFDHPGLPRQVFRDVSLWWEADTVLRMDHDGGQIYFTRVQVSEQPGRIDAVGVLAAPWDAHGAGEVRTGTTVTLAATGTPTAG